MALLPAFAFSEPLKGTAMKFPALPAVLVGFALAVAGPAAAANDVAAVQGGSAGEVPDDRELNDFVAAFVRMIGVQHGYMMLLQQEPDEAKAQQLKESAIQDMEAAIEKDGMSVDRYNQIALAIRDDPALQGRVEGILQELASDPSAPNGAPDPHQ